LRIHADLFCCCSSAEISRDQCNPRAQVLGPAMRDLVCTGDTLLPEGLGVDNGRRSATHDDRKASIKRRPRSPAGPGERGPGIPYSAITRSATNTGPGAASTIATSDFHESRSENSNTLEKPAPRAIAGRSTFPRPGT